MVFNAILLYGNTYDNRKMDILKLSQLCWTRYSVDSNGIEIYYILLNDSITINKIANSSLGISATGTVILIKTSQTQMLNIEISDIPTLINVGECIELLGDMKISEKLGDMKISEKLGDMKISEKLGDMKISEKLGDMKIYRTPCNMDDVYMMDNSNEDHMDNSNEDHMDNSNEDHMDNSNEDHMDKYYDFHKGYESF
jgi:hypothetical protein